MNLSQSEYLSWIDKASMLVFIAGMDDQIYSQSVRYNAAPDQRTDIQISPTSYGRLGGLYGTCINGVDEVKSYYSTGGYTTNGCLNSCYQDAIFDECECMDPRYAYPSGVTICGLSERTCVEATANARGDPSQWSSCVCPQPCSSGTYTIQWSQSAFVSNAIKCNSMPTYDKQQHCLEERASDSVYLSVQLPSLTTQTYKETPKMDFNKFIAYLGGLLGVLMGVSMFAFVEVAYLVVKLIFIGVSNR